MYIGDLEKYLLGTSPKVVIINVKTSLAGFLFLLTLFDFLAILPFQSSF